MAILDHLIPIFAGRNDVPSPGLSDPNHPSGSFITAIYNNLVTELDTLIPQPVTEPTTDPHFANVELLLKASEGHDSGTFTDLSNSSRTITPVNSVDVNQSFTDSGDVGQGSYYFDGNEGLSVAQGTDWDFGLGSFTIEAKHYLLHDPNVSYTLCTFAPSSGEPNTFHIECKRLGGIELGLNGVQYKIAYFPFFKWFHWALTGDGSNISLWLDGTLAFQIAQFSVSFPDGVALWGCNNTTSPDTGAASWMDYARVTNGINRYSSPFTPPKNLPTS